MSQPRSCWQCCFLWMLLGVLGIGATAVLLLFYAAKWLVAMPSPRAADAIVVLSGAPERARFAADLYAQKLAPVVYLSKPQAEPSSMLLEEVGVVLPREEEVNQRILRKYGVPASAIRFYGDGIISTFEEAMELKRSFSGRSVHLLVVTSPHHVRRAGMVFSRALSGTGLEFTVVPTPYEHLPEKWWLDQAAARYVLLELAKIAYFQVGGRFISAP